MANGLFTLEFNRLVHHYYKCLPNPTRSTPSMYPKALQSITRVGFVNLVGYSWSFLPPIPPLGPQLSLYLPQKFFQNFYKAGRLISSGGNLWRL